MMMLQACEQWLAMWGLEKPEEALREAVALVDHLKATLDGDSAGAFAAEVRAARARDKHRERQAARRAGA